MDSLDGHREWQLALLNGGVDLTEDVYEQRYADVFRASVPLADFAAIGEQLRRLGPWRMHHEVERRGDDVLAVQLVSDSGEQARLTLQRDADGRIEASTVMTATPCADAVGPDAELTKALSSQLRWIRDHFLDATVELAARELEDHFAPSFLEHVPIEALQRARGDIIALGPFSFRHYEGEPRATALTARLGIRTGEEARLTLSVEPGPPHRVTELSVFTQQPCRFG